MNRPIEFRGWDVDNKKMIYVNPVSSSHLHMTWDGLVYKEGKLQNIILMQFTGFYDTYDNKIFEGDVIHSIDRTFENDIYENDLLFINLVGKYVGMSLRALGTSNSIIFSTYTLKDMSKYEYRVVGNIYENENLIDSYIYR